MKQQFKTYDGQIVIFDPAQIETAWTIAADTVYPIPARACAKHANGATFTLDISELEHLTAFMAPPTTEPAVIHIDGGYYRKDAIVAISRFGVVSLVNGHTVDVAPDDRDRVRREWLTVN